MGIGSSSSEVVRHLLQHSKVKGSSPSAAGGSGKEKMIIKMFKWELAAAVAKW